MWPCCVFAWPFYFISAVTMDLHSRRLKSLYRLLERHAGNGSHVDGRACPVMEAVRISFAKLAIGVAPPLRDARFREYAKGELTGVSCQLRLNTIPETRWRVLTRRLLSALRCHPARYIANLQAGHRVPLPMLGAAD